MATNEPASGADGRDTDRSDDARTLRRLAARIARIGGWSLDVPSLAIHWSDELYGLLGWPLGTPPDLSRFVAFFDDAPRVEAVITACATKGTPFDLEVALRTTTGEPMWARIVGEPEHDGESTVVRIIGAFQDVTDQRATARRTAELAERLTATLEAVTDACYLLDADWRFTFLNASAEKLVQRRRGELLGRIVWEEFPQTLGTEVEVAYHRAVRLQQVERISNHPFPSLDTTFEIAAYPWDGGLAVFFHDVSGHIAREASLERTLRDERAVSERLRDLDRTKDAFLSAVSHELRTPLTVVRGMAHTLRDHRDELTPEVRRRVEDAMASSADRLDRLLRDLLDVDRLTRGGVACRRDRVDVVGLVRTICGEAVREGLVLDEPHVIGPPYLAADVDPVQLERVVHNLLENAGKYAPDAHVRVELSTLPQHGVRLEVRDDGPGIPSTELERIFQAFHRADQARPQPGTGVGLALVASFAQLHGGRAWAEPSSHGAHLVVELPGSRPTATSTVDPAADA